MRAPTADPTTEVYKQDSARLGMWIFLAMETLFFGSLFFLYAGERFANPAAFRLGSSHLESTLALINTALLLTSSFAMALAVESTKSAPKENARTRVFLLGTFALGASFLAVKAYEYKLDFDHALVPGLKFAPVFATPLADVSHLKLFFGLYFLATSIHAVHIVIGLGWITALTFAKSSTRTRVETLGLYWHFVDIVWIFLFPLFYLIGGAA